MGRIHNKIYAMTMHYIYVIQHENNFNMNRKPKFHVRSRSFNNF